MPGPAVRMTDVDPDDSSALPDDEVDAEDPTEDDATEPDADS